ncbi:L,D-transpeptidase family protein [Comamonas endophytica]|uniref:L,D-transpeptidase family protein n=1 Tax=Comamonas endophytica TaxID=2949090 RepID=A0ABY6GC75_9BURK|nr:MULTISPECIES: L,D-transpeptidase family protein [unclassified Acidovorax]MCD2512137.1 L,D-transpeptidase family protein [Acidovorax sp. D4N7]UYG51910.1 L,D-transpeptidase family protein [Acidovorax sp. 5MLIR]
MAFSVQAQPQNSKKAVGAAKAAKASKRTGAAAPKPASRAGLAATAGVAAGAGAVTALAAAKPAAPAPASAEARLLQVIDLVRRQELDAALQAAARLTADVPNFRAAQLVYADLLRFKTGRATSWAGAPASEVTELLVKHVAVGHAALAPPQQLQEQVNGLQTEIQRRVHAASALPAAASVPREFQRLGASVRHAIAIDASKSRLYLFAHEKGQLRLVRDFYVSIGKLGMGKSLEGDQRTPQGVYFIGRQIPGVRLPEFYGKGALTLNYPNDWDRAMNRSGDGIWLHGAPPDQFARLPEASDGCIVLANPDLIELMKTLDRQTPVLIRDKLQWAGPSDRAHAKATESFVRVLDGWQQAWKAADPQLLAKLYGGEPVAERFPKARLTELFRLADIAVQDLSVYAWKEAKGEIRIVEMQLGSQKARKALALRQYWHRTGDRWEVLSEEVRG